MLGLRPRLTLPMKKNNDNIHEEIHNSLIHDREAMEMYMGLADALGFVSVEDMIKSFETNEAPRETDR